MAGNNKGLDDSEFTMWRAVFAFSLVDHKLTLEEQKLLSQYLSSVPFSVEQTETLRRDFLMPQDVEALYNAISSADHKKRFCELARTLVWSKGDMDLQEKIILRRVACLGKGEGRTILRESRTSEAILRYHEEYEKAGISHRDQAPLLYQASV